MPEPFLYLQAIGAAAVISVFIVLLTARLRPTNAPWWNSAGVLGMAAGFAMGCRAINLRLAWPPANGLDRLLLIVLPLTCLVELIAGIPSVSRVFAWSLRIGLSIAIPRILLHGSVYRGETADRWTSLKTATELATSSVFLISSWALLFRLSQRSLGIPVALSIGLSTCCAGLCTMLAGYLKGGAVAFPFAVALVASTLAAKVMTNRDGTPSTAIIGVGVVGLFGWLFIGHFYGRLPTEATFALFLSPTLCWIAVTPPMQRRNAWHRGLLCLAIVSIPLMFVLTSAKQAFDRDMAPLLQRERF